MVIVMDDEVDWPRTVLKTSLLSATNKHATTTERGSHMSADELRGGGD